MVGPAPSALVVGEVDPAVDPALERLGCAVLRAGLETAFETATERGALHIATYGAARVCGVAAAEAVVAG